MHAIGVIVLSALASNLDNAGVGLSYGLRKVHVPWRAMALMAAISFIFTIVGGAVGDVIALWISPSVANVMGAVVIMAVGGWVIFESLRTSHHPKHEEQPHVKRRIGWAELLVIGVAQAINDLAVGFYAGVTHLDIWVMALAVGIFSLLIFYTAIIMGRHVVADRFGDKATLVAGILLIGVGLYEVIG